LGHAADAVVDRARAGSDPTARAAEAVVDLAVAVVVDAVAHLGAGCARRAVLRHAADAVVDGAPAGADPAGRLAEPVVDLSVAVVVFAVTDLGARNTALRLAVGAAARPGGIARLAAVHDAVPAPGPRARRAARVGRRVAVQI